MVRLADWILVVCLVVVACSTHAPATEWQAIQVPGLYPASPQTTHWVRTYVRVPDAWAKSEGLLADSVTLILESVVDVCRVVVNGEQVGTCGEIAPDYRSARDETHRLKIPPGTLQPGRYNCVILEIYAHDDRWGIIASPPIVAGYHEEVKLNGKWQYSVTRPLNDEWTSLTERPPMSSFDQVSLATSTLKRPATLNPGRHLAPAESLRQMTTPVDLQVDLVLCEPEVAQPLALRFDNRGRLWVMEYRQYPFPAGLRMLSRDKYYRATYDRIPLPPPQHDRGHDRISIHTDTNGDGQFDRHQIFLDQLNVASSLDIAPDGVWVLNPPYLLFYPDSNHDDIPDGNPEVHLSGFGLEDVHSVANSLTWGPDGWLYGAQGSTTSSHIRVTGRDDDAVYRDGAMVWRYHPQRHTYEVFAEGGGNSFGLEIDAQGRLFTGHNGGNTRGFYYPPGAYMQKGTDNKYGPLSNPFAYSPLPAMSHDADIPRFSHDLSKYEATTLPERYRGKLFAIDPLHQHVVVAGMQARGATFHTTDEYLALASTDLAFRPVEITVGPDGNVYVADFCEEFIAHGQHYQGQVDPDTGRVYRLRSAAHDQLATASAPVESTLSLVQSIDDATPEQLRDLLSHRDRGVRRRALRRLGAANVSDEFVQQTRNMLAGATAQDALELLWLLNLWNRETSVSLARWLDHRDPHVRRWTVRLLGERTALSDDTIAAFVRRASDESNIEVRAQLACTARRLAANNCLAIVRELLRYDADTDDAFQPSLLWWALEHAANEPTAMQTLLSDQAVWQRRLFRDELSRHLMRRYAGGNRADLKMAAVLLDRAPRQAVRNELLATFETSFSGRSIDALPETLVSALRSSDGLSLSLRIRLGDAAAIESGIASLESTDTPLPLKLDLAKWFGETQQTRALPTLLKLAATSDSRELLAAVLGALQAFPDPQITTTIVSRYPSWPVTVQAIAARTLAGRRTSARALLMLLDQGVARPHDMPEDVVALLHLQLPELDRTRLENYWPDWQTGDAGAASEQARVERAVRAGDANPYAGHQLFVATCAKCHQLFREGGNVGPNLTPYQRTDTARLILQIVNPNAELREGFESWTAITDEGRVVSGFLVDQDLQRVVLRNIDGQEVALPRGELESLERSRRSLMPTGLLQSLDDQQIRDLFAYLRISQPLNE